MTRCAKTKERCGPEALPCVVDEKVEEPKDLRILQGNDINDKKTFAAIMMSEFDPSRQGLDAPLIREVYSIIVLQYYDQGRKVPFHYILARELDARVQDVAELVAYAKNKPFDANAARLYLSRHWEKMVFSGRHSAWNYPRLVRKTHDGIEYYVLTTALLFDIYFYNKNINIFPVLLPVVQEALPWVMEVVTTRPGQLDDDVFDADTIAAEVPEIQVAPVPTAEMFFGAALRDAAAGGNEVYEDEDSVSEDEDTISEDEDTIAESVDVPQHVDNGALDKAIEASESNEMDDQSVFRQLEAGVLVARDRLKAQWAVAAAQAAEVHHLKAEAADHEALAAEVERLEAEAAAQATEVHRLKAEAADHEALAVEVERLEAEAAAQTAEVHRLKAEAADHEALAAAQAAEVHRLKAAARAADRLKTVVELLLEELGAKKTRKRSAQEGSDAETPAPKRIAP